ncbi:MAG TPA: CAP domain-containing protein [Candidatus Limnocylindria bacterium]
MSSAATFRAFERYVAIFVALAVQLAAVAVVGDVFAAAPRGDAGLPPPTETVARVAPAARGDRLMTVNATLDVVSEAAPAPNAEPETGPATDVAPEQTEELAPAPPPLAQPAPQPKPTPAPRPVLGAITASLETRQAEFRMLALMNASRLQGGLNPLALDAGVSDAARQHSAAEAQVRYVYHDGHDGTAASRDVPACGTGWYGENTGKVWSGGVDVLHREFMAEPWEPINHRTNIMDPNFRRAGIGAVQGPDAIYITIVFCR